jgi:septal ring-binding cell division protein DamX
MPLDINQDPGVPQEDGNIQPPVLHTPVQRSVTPGRIVFILFLLVVVASGAFLVKTFFLSPRKPHPAAVSKNIEVDTNGFAAAERARQAQANQQAQPAEQHPQNQQAQPTPKISHDSTRTPDVIPPAPKSVTEDKKSSAAGKKAAEAAVKTSQPPQAPAKNTEDQRPNDAGHYTIYIAAYRLQKPAQEEVGRWIDAGYQAFVVQARGRFCVTLGEYADKSEARKAAQQLSEGFENGYWIGTLDGKTPPPAHH